MKTVRIISAILLCIYIVAVAFLCFSKPDSLPELPTTWFGIPADKVVHFLMFAPFPILSHMTLCNENMGLIRQIMMVFVFVIIGAGLAIGTEQIQAILGYRSAEVTDFIADLAGLIFGCISTLGIIAFRRQK